MAPEVRRNQLEGALGSAPVKIEIGAGTKGMDGYIHVDAMPLEGVDVVDDGRTLATFEADSAEEIYCHWFLEHVAVHEVQPMLEAWKRVLQPRGIVRVITSNQEAINKGLDSRDLSWDEWIYLTYAVSNKPNYTIWDIHKSAWTPELVERALSRAGLVEIEVKARWACRETDGRLKCPALVASGVKP
jgi:predicted SAM-dependent methyltransferase